MTRKDSEALSRESLESMWIATFVATPEGKIVDVNRSACALLGYAREELLSMGMADIVGPENSERLMRAVREQIFGEEVSIESKGICRSGTHIPVQLSSTAIKIGDREMVVTMMRVSSNSKRSNGPCHTGR